MEVGLTRAPAATDDHRALPPSSNNSAPAGLAGPPMPSRADAFPFGEWDTYENFQRLKRYILQICHMLEVRRPVWAVNFQRLKRYDCPP